MIRFNFFILFAKARRVPGRPFQNRTVQLYFGQRSSSNGVFDIDLFGFPFTGVFNPIFRCLRTMKLKARNELFYGFCESAAKELSLSTQKRNFF